MTENPNETITELKKRDILRLSNEESNKITRECIQTALLLLMKETPFDKITITAIVKRSGVSRMAFYRNFSSKQDVLFDLGDSLYKKCVSFIRESSTEEDCYKLYHSIFQLFVDNKDILDSLLNAGIRTSEFMDLNKIITSHYKDAPPKKKYSSLCWWGSLEAIIAEWYERGMQESIDDMSQICTEVLPPLPL